MEVSNKSWGYPQFAFIFFIIQLLGFSPIEVPMLVVLSGTLRVCIGCAPVTRLELMWNDVDVRLDFEHVE